MVNSARYGARTAPNALAQAQKYLTAQRPTEYSASRIVGLCL